MDTGLHLCFSCHWKGNFEYLVKYTMGFSDAQVIEWIEDRDTFQGLVERPDREEKPKHEPITEADLAFYTIPPVAARESRLLSLESVEDYGVLWEPEKELWITPVRDPDTNKLWGWQEKNSRYFRNRPRGIQKSKTLFGLAATEGLSTCILVESPLDCARIQTAGLSGSVATMGSAISDEQIDLLLRRFRYIVSAMDNDEAGDKANDRLMQSIPLHRLKFWAYIDVPYDDEEYRKDPGDQSDEEIHISYADAYRALGARFK